MKDADGPSTVDVSPQRDATDEDYDLLTYDEAAVRLADEIVRETERLAEHEQVRPPSAGSTRDAETSRRRLADLRDAQQRMGRHALNAENFERFFGYPPADAARGVE